MWGYGEVWVRVVVVFVVCVVGGCGVGWFLFLLGIDLLLVFVGGWVGFVGV